MTMTSRDFESFTWFTLREQKIMLGVGWSGDWATTKPWSVNGETVPYISARLIGQTENTKVLGFFLGPVAVLYGKSKK